MFFLSTIERHTWIHLLPPCVFRGQTVFFHLFPRGVPCRKMPSMGHPWEWLIPRHWRSKEATWALATAKVWRSNVPSWKALNSVGFWGKRGMLHVIHNLVWLFSDKIIIMDFRTVNFGWIWWRCWFLLSASFFKWIISMKILCHVVSHCLTMNFGGCLRSAMQFSGLSNICIQSSPQVWRLAEKARDVEMIHWNAQR